MKKMLSAVLVISIITTLLSGCSLFSTESNGGNEGGSAGSIEMTDKYTFTDPTDLEFEKRYVAYGDENSYTVSDYASAGYGVAAMYSVYYADQDDAPLGYYDFIVCTSAEDAQKLAGVFESVGQVYSAVDEDPCVLYSFTDGDAFDALITMTQSGGSISEPTVKAYVDFYIGMMGYVLQ